MNLRKLFLPLCSVALCLQSYAQNKSFLKDMLWYIDNPSVFEKGQEEGHAPVFKFLIPLREKTNNPEWNEVCYFLQDKSSAKLVRRKYHKYGKYIL